MMSAQRGWHRPTGPYASGSQRRNCTPCVAATASVPLFLIRRDPTVILLTFLRGGDVLVLHKSSLCRANLARGLRIHLAGPRDSWRPSSALTSPARASTPSLSRCRDVCGDR
jgi:hypothetical protein